MNNLEIIIEAEGLEPQISEITKKCDVKIDFDRASNLDGTLVCTIVGTTVNVGMFLMQAYSLWGNKRVSLVDDNIRIDEVTIKKVLDYIKQKQE